MPFLHANTFEWLRERYTIAKGTKTGEPFHVIDEGPQSRSNREADHASYVKQLSKIG